MIVCLPVLVSGAEFTKTFPPVRVHETKPKKSTLDELTTTLEYMKKYGIQNVRGSKYVQVELTQEQIYEIKTSFWSTFKNMCQRCGRTTHLAKDCNAKTDVDKDRIPVSMTERRDETKKVTKKAGRSPKTFPRGSCFRCGHDSHYADSCYASFDIDGDPLSASELESESETEPKSPSSEMCFRCGREGHWADACYAKTHRNGDRL